MDNNLGTKLITVFSSPIVIMIIITLILIIVYVRSTKKSGAAQSTDYYFNTCNGQKCTVNPRLVTADMPLCPYITTDIDNFKCNFADDSVGYQFGEGDKKCCSVIPNLTFEKMADGKIKVNRVDCNVEGAKTCSLDPNDTSIPLCKGIQPPMPGIGNCAPGMLPYPYSGKEDVNTLPFCCATNLLEWKVVDGVGQYVCSDREKSETVDPDLRRCTVDTARIGSDNGIGGVFGLCPPASGKEQKNEFCPQDRQFAFTQSQQGCCEIRPVGWTSGTKPVTVTGTMKLGPTFTNPPNPPQNKVLITGSNVKQIIIDPENYSFAGNKVTWIFDSQNVPKINKITLPEGISQVPGTEIELLAGRISVQLVGFSADEQNYSVDLLI